MILGKGVEQAIANWYAQEHQREIVWLDETLTDERWPFMTFTPDAICRFEPRGLDAKFVNWDQRHLWDDDEPPLRYVMQAQYYMIPYDYPHWDIVALIGSANPRVITVERDPEVQEALLDIADHFWRTYLVGDQRPPITATDTASRWLKQKFPRHQPLLRRANPHEELMLDEYAELTVESRKLAAQKAQLEAELKLAVGSAEGIECERAKFTWKNTKDSSVTDWECIARSLMARVDKADRECLIGLYTSPKPGVRRVWFRHDGVNE